MGSFNIDRNGRVIPDKNLKNAVCDPNQGFRLIPPELKNTEDYAARLVRFQEAFKSGPVMSAADFEQKSSRLIDEIKNDQNLANLFKGIFLPIILPRVPTFTDYTECLDNVLLPAVRSSYEKQFPNRKFYTYRRNESSGKVGVVPGTRHDQLIESIKHDFLVAIYFPNSLQGFSVLASREQVAFSPESFVLSGGLDITSGIAIYPDVLAKDWYVPGYDLAALSWQSLDYSLFFLVLDDRLIFDDGGILASSRGGNCSSGLLFMGNSW